MADARGLIGLTVGGVVVSLVFPLGPESLPEWAPGPADVADYVPHRTLARVPVGITGSQDQFRLTFDETTRPTGVQVQRLIANAVALISSRLTPIHVSSESAAGTLVKILAALWVERSWPNDGSSLERARDMEKTYTDMLAGLIASNADAVAGDGDPETVDVVLPYWSFPPADTRWDSPTYW